MTVVLTGAFLVVAGSGVVALRRLFRATAAPDR